MEQFTLSGNQYFDTLPQPVLLVREHRLCYFNRAAERAFWPVTLEVGGALPAALAQEADGAVTLGAQSWVCQKRQLPEGALFVLRQVMERGEYQVLLNRLAGRNAAQLQQLSRAIRTLETHLVETERLRNEKELAQLRQVYARMMRTDQNISYFCQMEQEDPEENFPMRVLDAAGLCREVHRQCGYLLEMADITLVYEEQAASLLVQGNEKLLFHLLYNLLNNSAHSYLNQGGIITLRVTQVGQCAMITVEDNGQGMPSSVLQNAFELQTSPSYFLPFGLGLPLGRKIANYHRGGLFLLNKEQGCQAVLSLPMVQAKSLRRQEVGQAERLASLRMVQGTFHPALVGLSDVVPATVFAAAAED